MIMKIITNQKSAYNDFLLLFIRYLPFVQKILLIP